MEKVEIILSDTHNFLGKTTHVIGQVFHGTTRFLAAYKIGKFFQKYAMAI